MHCSRRASAAGAGMGDLCHGLLNADVCASLHPHHFGNHAVSVFLGGGPMELICVIETSTISLASNAAMILRRSSGLSSRSATCERCLARPFFYVRPT